MPVSYAQQNQGVDWSTVAQAARLKMAVNAYQEQQAADAIRWQGVQDYQEDVNKGMTPAEALKRNANKLFYNDPQGLVNSISRMHEPPKIVDINGREFIQTPTNLRQLSQPNYGWRTVTDESGQSYRVRLTKEQAEQAPAESAPLPEATIRSFDVQGRQVPFLIDSKGRPHPIRPERPEDFGTTTIDLGKGVKQTFPMTGEQSQQAQQLVGAPGLPPALARTVADIRAKQAEKAAHEAFLNAPPDQREYQYGLANMWSRQSKVNALTKEIEEKILQLPTALQQQLKTPLPQPTPTVIPQAAKEAAAPTVIPLPADPKQWKGGVPYLKNNRVFWWNPKTERFYSRPPQ